MEYLGQYPETEEENVRYDTVSFPLYIVQGNLIMFRDMAVHCHWHDDLELIYVLKGHMTYNINGKIVLLDKGEGIFVNSRQLHFGYSADGTDCDYICILVSLRHYNSSQFLAERFLLPVTENEGIEYLHLIPSITYQNSLLEQIRLCFDVYQEAAPGFQLEIEASFLKMLGILYRNMPKKLPIINTQERTDTERMKQMLAFAESHLAEPVTLSDIAGAAGISVGTCTRLFRHYLHRTPVEYLIELRLEKAAYSLKESELSVTEIAYASGFTDSSYFTHRFRSRYGCTPTQYRKGKNALSDSDSL